MIKGRQITTHNRVGRLLKEDDVEDNGIKVSKELGYISRKFTSPARRSVPDRLFVNNCGITIYIEFKRPGQTPTPAQWREISKLRAQGAPAFWSDCFENTWMILEHWQWISDTRSPLDPEDRLL